MGQIAGSDGVYVYVYDYPSGEQQRGVLSTSPVISNAVTGLVVDDLNGDGNKENRRARGVRATYTHGTLQPGNCAICDKAQMELY